MTRSLRLCLDAVLEDIVQEIGAGIVCKMISLDHAKLYSEQRLEVLDASMHMQASCWWLAVDGRGSTTTILLTPQC